MVHACMSAHPQGEGTLHPRRGISDGPSCRAGSERSAREGEYPPRVRANPTIPEKMISEMRISSTHSGGPVRARNAPGRDLNLDVLDRRTREGRERSLLMQETGTFDWVAPRGQGTLRRARRRGHRPRESAVWHSTFRRAPRPGLGQSGRTREGRERQTSRRRGNERPGAGHERGLPEAGGAGT